MYDDGWNDMGKPTAPPLPVDPQGEVLRYMGQTGLDAQKGADILSTVARQLQLRRVSTRRPRSATSLKADRPGQARPGSGRASSTPSTTASTPTPPSCYVHGKLWRDVSEAVAAFFADLREHDAADDVIMLLWSEFGRRVKDNGAGTDHGAGGAAFLIGEPVKGGMYGEYPSLKETT